VQPARGACGPAPGRRGEISCPHIDCSSSRGPVPMRSLEEAADLHDRSRVARQPPGWPSIVSRRLQQANELRVLFQARTRTVNGLLFPASALRTPANPPHGIRDYLTPGGAGSNLLTSLSSHHYQMARARKVEAMAMYCSYTYEITKRRFRRESRLGGFLSPPFWSSPRGQPTDRCSRPGSSSAACF